MDCLSFVFSLLLIVSVTTFTFGSVIKAKNPDGESPEEPRSDPYLVPNLHMAPKKLKSLLKRSHLQPNPDMKTDAQAKLQRQNGLKDKGSEMSKQGDPETLIPGTITVPSLQKRLTKHQAGTGCTLVIGIENQSGFAWNGVSNLLIAGTAEKTLPDYVPNGKSFQFVPYNEQKTLLIGLLVYYIEDINFSLAIMYRVHTDANFWNMKMYRGDRRATFPNYQDIIMNPPRMTADDQWHNGDLDFVHYRVFMSTSPQAILKIEIFKSQ